MKKSTLTILLVLGFFVVVSLGTGKIIYDFKVGQVIEKKNLQCNALAADMNLAILNDTESSVSECRCYYENIYDENYADSGLESYCTCECALVGYDESNCWGTDGWDFFADDGKCWTRLHIRVPETQTL